MREFKSFLDKYNLDYLVEGESEFNKIKKSLKAANDNNKLTFSQSKLFNLSDQYFDNMRNNQFSNRKNQKWIKDGLRREFSKVIYGLSQEIKAKLYNDEVYNKAVDVLLNQKTYSEILNL